jgi:hypothetical protein
MPPPGSLVSCASGRACSRSVRHHMSHRLQLTVHGTWFDPRSDIDMAVKGVPAEAFWRACRALDRLDPAFEIDLVAI